MPQFSLIELFQAMGFCIEYNQSHIMLLGYNNCQPMAAVIQVNSLDSMNEPEIEFHLRSTQIECPEIAFTIILNFGGFTCPNGNYKNQAFLLDRLLMAQIIRGIDIFHDILLAIIQMKGKPVQNSSLQLWANNRAKLALNGNTSESELQILVKSGFIHCEQTHNDKWDSNLAQYMNYINSDRSKAKLAEEIKRWAIDEFDNLSANNLSERKLEQMYTHQMIWDENCSESEKLGELIHFIENKNRLPFDYECKLFRFMQTIRKRNSKPAVLLREVLSYFKAPNDKLRIFWLHELNAVVSEYKAAGRKIWKLKVESLSWINSQFLEENDSWFCSFKKMKIANLLDYNGEDYDFNWLEKINAYSQLKQPPAVKTELWLWAVSQRGSQKALENYKRRSLESIQFDFTGTSKHWYDCYTRYSTLSSTGQVADSHIGKDGIFWAYSNRKAYAEGTLSDDKLSLLQEIGFDFKLAEFNWLHYCDKVKQLYDVNRWQEEQLLNIELKNWCNLQRTLISGLKLQNVNHVKLINTGFIYADPEFEEFITLLAGIVNQYDGLPKDYESISWISSNPYRLAFAREANHRLNPALSKLKAPEMAYYPVLLAFWKDEENRWKLYTANIQKCADYLRAAHRVGELPNQIIDELTDAGFQWAEEGVEDWLFMLSTTVRFIQLFNRLPMHNDKECSVWRFKQLREYRKNILSDFKHNALTSIITPAYIIKR